MGKIYIYIYIYMGKVIEKVDKPSTENGFSNDISSFI